MKQKLSRKKALIYGNFNVVHPGHTRLFSFAKSRCDHLVVAVFGDKFQGKNTIIPEELRIESLQSISIIDEVMACNDSLVQLIEEVRPDVIIKGSEFAEQNNPEQEIAEKLGVELIFYSGPANISTISLLKKEMELEEVHEKTFPAGYLKRHSVDPSILHSTIEKFRKLNVLVIGDLIVDEYISCEPIGMSQEEPCVVFSPFKKDSFVGGAGIVASHARTLGANVKFITTCGDDHFGERSRHELESLGIECHHFVEDGRVTTNKQRFRSRNKTVFKTSTISEHPISQATQASIINLYGELISETDLIIFSDFNYGCLTANLTQELINKANSLDVFISADSQSSSQIGNLDKFANVALVTPTEREARLCTQNTDGGLAALASSFCERLNCKNSIITLGEDGVLIYNATKSEGKIFTDRLPALNEAPVDVSGAGDSLLTTASLAMAAGADIWTASAVGSIAASIQVSRLGNKPITKIELSNAIKF